ncbi:unnamed protein product [Urochloa humidicola]
MGAGLLVVAGMDNDELESSRRWGSCGCDEPLDNKWVCALLIWHSLAMAVRGEAARQAVQGSPDLSTEALPWMAGTLGCLASASV